MAVPGVHSPGCSPEVHCAHQRRTLSGPSSRARSGGRAGLGLQDPAAGHPEGRAAVFAPPQEAELARVEEEVVPGAEQQQIPPSVGSPRAQARMWHNWRFLWQLQPGTSQTPSARSQMSRRTPAGTYRRRASPLPRSARGRRTCRAAGSRKACGSPSGMDVSGCLGRDSRDASVAPAASGVPSPPAAPSAASGPSGTTRSRSANRSPVTRPAPGSVHARGSPWPESWRPESWRPESWRPASWRPASWRPASWRPASWRPESRWPATRWPASRRPLSRRSGSPRALSSPRRRAERCTGRRTGSQSGRSSAPSTRAPARWAEGPGSDAPAEGLSDNAAEGASEVAAEGASEVAAEGASCTRSRRRIGHSSRRRIGPGRRRRFAPGGPRRTACCSRTRVARSDGGRGGRSGRSAGTRVPRGRIPGDRIAPSRIPAGSRTARRTLRPGAS